MQQAKSFSTGIYFLLMIAWAPLQGCSKYTVTTSNRDPADVYYKKRIAASFFWGIINNPKNITDTACGKSGLSDVKVTSNVGYSLLNVVTLGIVHLVKVEWKCQKEKPVVGFQP